MSATFHGRDIFAPVAAWLSKGEDIRSLGVPENDPVQLELQEPTVSSGTLHGRVVRNDHFGNMITNISRDTLTSFLAGAPPVIRIGSLELTEISRTYSTVPEDQALAPFGSSGFLEIAINGDSAAGRLNPEDREIVIEKLQAR